MEEKKNPLLMSTKTAIIFYSALFGTFLLFLIIMSLEEPKYQLPPTANAGSGWTQTGMMDVSVTTSTSQRGDFLVVTTKVKNDSDYSFNRDLGLFLVDSVGNKHILDTVYVDLLGGEIGTVDSSKRLDKINGPPPYKVVTEWK